MGRENRGGGEGLMLALILVTHLVDGNMQKRDQEIVTIDFNSPRSFASLYSYFGKIYRFDLSSDNHENDNDLTKINANQIYSLNKYRDQRNVSVN